MYIIWCCVVIVQKLHLALKLAIWESIYNQPKTYAYSTALNMFVLNFTYNKQLVVFCS